MNPSMQASRQHSTDISLVFDQVTKKYGRVVAVDNISFSIPKGSLVTLLGPSGCGKTTTLRMIAGLESVTQGRILLNGEDVTRQSAIERNVSMVFQSYALFPHMTVLENVAYGLTVSGMPKREAEQRAIEGLSLVGLADYGPRLPSELSGGQQQRVAVARALVLEPQVLLLDEPLSNLDKKLREQMRLELKRLQRKLGITTIFVTHDQEEAMTTADRMAVLEAGVLQQVGTPHELFDTPANRFVAEFVGSTNLLAGRSDNARRVFIADGFGEIPLTGNASGTAISVRPHAIAIAEARDTARVWFDGAIEESEFLGEFTRYGVRVGPTLLTADAPHLSATPIYSPGMRVQIGIDPDEVRVLD